MNKCPGCMEDIAEGKRVCPHCGYTAGDGNIKEAFLLPGTMLRDKYLVGSIVEETALENIYIGYSTFLDKKIVIREYFPKEYLARSPGVDTAEIKPGCLEAYEGRLGEYASEAKKSISAGGSMFSNVHDSFLENNTCYVIENYSESIRKIKADRKKEDKPLLPRTTAINNKSTNVPFVGKKVKILALVLMLFIFFSVSIVFLLSKKPPMPEATVVKADAVYVSTDGETYFEMEFSNEEAVNPLKSNFEAQHLDKDLIGDAKELFIKVDTQKNTTAQLWENDNEIVISDNGVYVVPLNDTGTITIELAKGKGVDFLKTVNTYSFTYSRRVYTTLMGIGYVLNDDGNQLIIPDFNPDVHDYVIETASTTRSIHINAVIADKNTVCKINYVGSENSAINKDANKTGKFIITPENTPCEIYVEIEIKDAEGNKEDGVYRLTFKVPKA